jgi:hypothetical protein
VGVYAQRQSPSTLFDVVAGSSKMTDTMTGRLHSERMGCRIPGSSFGGRAEGEG